MKFALARRSAVGKEKPRSITPFTTLNIVVTPQIPRASTMTAERAERFFLDENADAPIRRSWPKVSATIVGLDDGR